MLVMIAIAGVGFVVLALLFILITVAIRAEDKRATATYGPPPNPLAHAARRVTGLHVHYATPPDYDDQPTAEASRAHGQRR